MRPTISTRSRGLRLAIALTAVSVFASVLATGAATLDTKSTTGVRIVHVPVGTVINAFDINRMERSSGRPGGLRCRAPTPWTASTS
jgi:hypothetical protein